MPLKSKKQMKEFFYLESKGKLPKGTTKKWMAETPNLKRLPEYSHKRKNK